MKTPKGFRLHIGIFGRRNAGKSSILNALTRQAVSIVSDIAGTTTDPVEKPMELLPLGPVLFIDTAGIDDTAEKIGEMRVEKTRQIFDRTDIALIVTTPQEWTNFEEHICEEMDKRKTPVLVIINKCDTAQPSPQLIETLNNKKIPYLESIATEGKGILELRELLIKNVPDEFVNAPGIVSDLMGAGEMAILVVPIDAEAPKGRLILPQVQTIREILDIDAYSMVVKERELKDALNRLKAPPKIVITDSQAFLKVSADTPDDILMTSFSILFARLKGDLSEFVRGAAAIESLKPGDKVLIAESCSHHPIADDIGRVKIPRWLTQYVGGKLDFGNIQGHDFPENLEEYKLVIHCGGCMWNRREMLSRIMKCREKGVPITNYGLSIAYTLGIFERALKAFPAALEAYKELI